jgi:TM2 domain-containing membrane protein YozV
MLKSKVDTYLLHTFFGFFGAGRFYLGDVKLGLINLFTFGGFGILWLLDFFFLIHRVNKINALIEAMFSFGDTASSPIDSELLRELKNNQGSGLNMTNQSE